MKSPKKARFNFMPRSGDFCFRERGIFVDATVGYKKNDAGAGGVAPRSIPDNCVALCRVIKYFDDVRRENENGTSAAAEAGK